MRLRTVGLQGATLTTTAAVTARSFRGRRRLMVPILVSLLMPFLTPLLGPPAMRTWRRPAGTVLLRRGSRVAMALAGTLGMMALGAAILPRQSDADQPLDVAQIAHLLGARDQRDGDAV